MTEKKYIISKNGQQVANISRVGLVTILDKSLGVAYSEPEENFSAYINELKQNGYTITLNN